MVLGILALGAVIPLKTNAQARQDLGYKNPTVPMNPIYYPSYVPEPVVYYQSPAPTPIVYSSTPNQVATTAKPKTVAKATTKKTTAVAKTDEVVEPEEGPKELAANAIFGANTFTPSGIIQWILFAILVLVSVILVRKIYGADQKYHAAPMKHD